MSTPWKTAEDAFWDWLAVEVRLPSTLKIYRSHQGKGLPFLDDVTAFSTATAMPGMWLSLVEIEPEIQGPTSQLDYLVFRGGLAMNVPADDTTRDTFETLINDVREAILGGITAGVDEIDVSELTQEKIRAVTPPGKYAPVIGYVWEFRLRFGYTAHHTP